MATNGRLHPIMDSDEAEAVARKAETKRNRQAKKSRDSLRRLNDALKKSLGTRAGDRIMDALDKKYGRLWRLRMKG